MRDSLKYLRTIGILCAWTSVTFIFAGCGKHGREVLANIIFVQGPASIDKGGKGGGASQPATTASKLSVGDRFQTSRDAAAAISLVPGIFIQVGGGTEIVIKELRVDKTGDAMVDAIKSRLATVWINRGVVRVSLPEVGTGRCELNVQTDLGTMMAQRGALVSVLRTSEMARVVCVDGEVRWRSVNGRRVDGIEKGYFQDYVPDPSSNDVVKLKAEPVWQDGAVQKDVTDVLDAAAAFDEFSMRVRNAPLPKSSHPVKPQRPKVPQE